MTALVEFTLECVAFGVAIAVVLNLAVDFVRLRLRAWAASARASVRADTTLCLALLPGLAAVLGALGAALPSLLARFGWAEDHCATHGHHGHICFLHVANGTSGVAWVGVAFGALVLWRISLFARREFRAQKAVLGLTKLGRTIDGVTWVASDHRLCSAVGVIRPRVLVSEALREILDPPELEATLAHERAHVERQDPLALFLLGFASAFLFPALARALRASFVSASEEASDADAHSKLGRGDILASALVKLLRLGPPELELGASMRGSGLEERVLRLLEGPFLAAPARAPRALAAACPLAVLATVLAASTIHHAAETILRLWV